MCAVVQRTEGLAHGQANVAALPRDLSDRNGILLPRGPSPEGLLLLMSQWPIRTGHRWGMHVGRFAPEPLTVTEVTWFRGYPQAESRGERESVADRAMPGEVRR